MVKVKNYLSLIKFSHTIFALPFALIGFFLATHYTYASFEWTLLILIILCMVFARSAAMAFNRYTDREIDKKNERTAAREIPSGAISSRSAIAFVVINSLLFILTTYFINPLCFYLSPVALLIILGYSYTKRFTFLCHIFLGLGLSLAPLGAYLAVTQQFDLLPVLFSLAVLFWVSGFDIIYALQDVHFDQKEKLLSIPSFFGKKKALAISNILHTLSGALVIYAGIFAGFSTFYWIGAAIFLLLLFYQHTLVKPNDLKKVDMAFFTTNGIASVIFAVFVLLDLFLN